MAIVIDHAGYVISTPGGYVLGANLVHSGSTGAAITVTCSNVNIDLAGHTISGNGLDNSLAYGIRADRQANIDVRNGTISGFYTGVSLDDNQAGLGAGGFDVTNLRVLDSTFRGIRVSGSNSRVTDCYIGGVTGSTAFANSFAAGIELFGNRGLVTGNDIREVHPRGTGEGLGISISSNSNTTVVSDNTIINQRPDGLSSYGVWVGGPSTVTVRDNVITNYENGFAYSSPTAGTFQGNIIDGWYDAPFVATSRSAVDRGGNTIRLTEGDDTFAVRDFYIGRQVAVTGFTIIGEAGNDTIVATPKNDTLMGGYGADNLNGGSGIDTVSFADAAYHGFVLSLIDPLLNSGPAEGDVYTSIENVTLSAGDDTAYGDANANALRGEGGNDRLIGMGGNDTLMGGYGADALDGGDGVDTASFADAAYGSFRISLTDQRLNTGPAAGDTYVNIENITMSRGNDIAYGNATVNVIRGQDGNDKLFGMNNNDRLHGENGNDVLFGGLGADLLDGGAGFDYAAYDDAAYADFIVSLTAASLNTGVAAGDTFVSIEGLILSSGNDTAYGNAAGNYIYGRDGDDTISGYAGNDFLFGELGADTFLFNTRPSSATNRDAIGDFESGIDLIGLAARYFGAAGNAAGDVRLYQGDGVTGRDVRAHIGAVLFDTDTGAVYYDRDGAGSTAAIQFATLTGVTDLQQNDFFFV